MSKQVLTQFGAQADELEAVAPSKVRSDVKAVLDGLRRAGGGDAGATKASGFVDAQRRIAAYGQKLTQDPKIGCQQGGGSGDG